MNTTQIPIDTPPPPPDIPHSPPDISRELKKSTNENRSQQTQTDTPRPVPNGYPNPTRYPVFHLIYTRPDSIQF